MFERDTSPLYASNDGRLKIDSFTGTEGRCHVLVDTVLDTYPETRDLRDLSPNVVTQQQTVIDAFIAGYDYAERLIREALAPVVARLNETRREYSENVEPGISDDSVLEAERDALEWALGQINGALKGGA